MGAHLDRSLQQHVEDVGPLLHLPDVQRVGVATLAVFDRIDEPIGEFPLGTEQVGLHKVHHSVVCTVDTCRMTISMYAHVHVHQ